jgi:hypothetical protein
MPTDKTVIIPNANILNVALSPTNGSLVAQIGDVTNEDVENYDAQWVQQSGFCSIPPNAVPNQTASEGVVLKTQYRDYVIGCRDFNTQANYGNLGPGEFCVYAAGADGSTQGKVVGKTNGSVTIYTTDDNTSTGNGVYMQISPTAWTFVAPWGSFVFDKTGVHINTVSGAGFNLGGFAAAGPFATLIGNICNITASSTTISSPFISLGDGVNTPVISSMLPLTIAAPVISISTPLLNLGDLTTPMNIVAPSLLTVTATAGIAATSVATIDLTAITVNLTGIINLLGVTNITQLTGIIGLGVAPGLPLAPGAAALGLPFVNPG